MKTYHQDGRVLDHTLAADCVSGEVIVKGSMVGVAVSAGKSGQKIALHVEGVVELPKLSTAVIADGAANLIWDVSAKQVIVASAATGDVTGFGVAVAAAGNGATSVLVKLTPGRGTVSA